MAYELQDLINMYNSGMSYDNIAKTIGKSNKLISKLLKGHITPRLSIRKKVIHEQIMWETIDDRNKLIIELYTTKSCGSYIISKILNVDKKTVLRVLKINNISRNKQIGYLNKVEINKLYNEDKLSISEIANVLNVSSEAIRYHIDKPRDNADALSCIPIDLQPEILRLVKEEKLSSYKIAEKYGYQYQSVQKFLKRHKLSPGLYTKEWKEAVQRGIITNQSSLEKQVAKILNDNNINYEDQFSIEEFRYDFKIAGLPILIEVQGSYWHTKRQRIQRDEYKRKLAISKGYKLLIIWDYELSKPNNIISRIINAISPVNFDFSQCNIKIDDWTSVINTLEDYHYQGRGRAGITITANYNNIITAVAVFSTCTRQETVSKQNCSFDEILELNRMVIVPAYQSRNFATWFLSRAIKLLKSVKQVKKLIAFSDPTFGHDGTIYRANNWKFDGYTSPSYWYYHRRQNKIIHKKTIWNAAKKNNISEDIYAKSKNLLKVNGQKKLRFIMELV